MGYDARGNTTTLGTQALGYDGADRHVVTTVGATSLRYERDGTGRIIDRKLGATTTARYGFTGPGDNPAFATDTTGAVTERYVGLVGGVLLTIRATTQVWSHPNIHGDVMATTDAAGTKAGPTHTYDPYGVALGGLPDNAAGNYDWGWLGQHQRGIETEAGLATIEMGARQYLPTLGRFLSGNVNPIWPHCDGLKWPHPAARCSSSRRHRTRCVAG